MALTVGGVINKTYTIWHRGITIGGAAPNVQKCGRITVPVQAIFAASPISYLSQPGQAFLQ